MRLALTFSIDEDVIEVHYHKNVEFLCQDLVEIALERDWCISQSKRHDLILEVAIAGPESRFTFISFLNPHLMVEIGQIELGEPSSSS